MFKYKIFILFLGIFVFSLVVVGFSIVGTPSSQQELRFDEIRMTDFSRINSEIQNYFTKNRFLPTDLQIINNQGNLQTNDPKNKTPYNYEILSTISYKLCTNFSTDSQVINNTNYYENTYNSQKHKKGFDCIIYTLPEYLQRETPTPIFRSPTFFPSPTILPNRVETP